MRYLFTSASERASGGLVLFTVCGSSVFIYYMRTADRYAVAYSRGCQSNTRLHTATKVKDTKVIPSTGISGANSMCQGNNRLRHLVHTCTLALTAKPDQHGVARGKPITANKHDSLQLGNNSNNTDQVTSVLNQQPGDRWMVDGGGSSFVLQLLLHLRVNS